MKKSVKRAMTTAMAGMLAGSLLLSGCGQKTLAKTKSEGEGKTEIKFWFSAGKTAVNVMEELISGYNASQDQYVVTGVTQADYDETYAKVQAGIASKTAGDVVLLDTDKARNLARKGLVENLRNFTVADESFDQKDFVDVFFNQGLLEGDTLFALPAYGTTAVMYYNRELFSEAGVKPEDIKTWQDLAVAAKKIAKKDGEETTRFGWEPMWGADNLVDAAYSNGAKLLSEDGKTVTINSEEWVEAWEAVRGWIFDDQIMTIHHGGQGWEYWYKTMDDAVNGVAGGYTGSSGDQADLDFSKVGAMEQPGFNENPSAPVARALELVMIKQDDENVKQGAYDFMRYITAPEQQAKWSMGTGYVAVRKSTQDVPEYQEYIEKNPQASVPLDQAMHASVKTEDPTGGKIYDALDIAADKVEIENIPAKEALDEAQRTAQKALDELR